MMTTKFPRNIYQVWFQGCNNIDQDKFKINMKKWRDLNPEWNYYCVDNSFLENACKKFSEECYSIYKKLDVMHMKIDLGRYVLIYLYGGMYADMDAFILRPLDFSKKVKEIINTYEKNGQHVIGLSSVPLNRLETFFMTWRFHSVALNNAIMFSSPENPILKQYIEHIINKIKETTSTQHLNTNYLKVQNTTGPMTFNHFFNEQKDRDNKIIIFEPNVFEPCTMDQQCQIDENTIALHLFESSWVSPLMKGLVSIYFIVKPYLLIILAIAVWYFYYNKTLVKFN
jgi:mannosyltransferase OCH1-like enzyme